METILAWATILSPLIGVVAIVLSSISSSRSLKKMNQQIEAVNNLLDVFVAAENPVIMEAKRKYEQQLVELDKQIKKLVEDIQTFSPYFGRGTRGEAMEELFKKNAQCEQLEVLESKRDEIKGQLDLILSYIERTKKK